MAVISYTTTTPILLAVRLYLAALKVLPIDRIIVVGDENEPKMQGTQLLQLWPQDFVDDKSVTHGAGRNGMHITEPFWIQILTQLQTDEVDRNLQGFTDPKLGHYNLRTAVLDAMHLCWPTDAPDGGLGGLGNALTVQPIHLAQGSKGRKPRAPRSGGWTVSNIVFEVRYRQLLTLSRQ